MNYIEKLSNILPEDRVTTNQVVLENHSKDESYHQPHLPDVVVFPNSAEEVSAVMKIANEEEIPVVPFGLGTSLEGAAIPYTGGISLDFSQMNKILEIIPEDFLVKVQPGVTRIQLNEELKKHGLFFSVDPGADATLGGMAATNASGTTAVRYGVMRDQVRDLEVVLADGTIMNTGSLAAKSSSGYNLNGLFVGSEGTLGCFTELTLRVYGIPEETVAARASFKTIDEAVQGVVAIRSAGIQIARIELLCEESMRRINAFSETNYLEQPALFMEFHGNQAGLEQDIQFAEEILADFGCEGFQFEKDTQSRNKLWEARHNHAYSFMHSNPGKKAMVTDVCMPISHLTGAINYASERLENLGIVGGIVGHAGDGNYHTILMIDLNNPEEIALGNQFNKDIVEYALARGGSCTGEHGVGVGKMKYQEMEHGNSLEIMKTIKRSLDPKNILNPGKVISI
ncbi:FAD-binding oxidoreductase [Ornithinibacillus sp. 4-3]|uniref:D-lactate dehydrogenase (cytochrome) n=1 Tax=Ornithinibacillus sp. 4-3 TaxID=3231488 RepID=A0AB39HSU4_9BACI